jgi:3-hydroxypropanoate dehydrogenase
MQMRPALSSEALDQLFLEARTRNAWTDRPVTDADIQRMYELAKFGPTAANATPARFVWIRSPEAKARLEPLLSDGNKAKTMAAPAVVIVAYDVEFPPTMTKLFPHVPGAENWFPGDRARAEALRSGTLQGAYLIMAARSLGFDCGPMAGFDNEGVDREFLAGTAWKSNFLCNIGEGTDENLFPRLPRLDFDEANRLL